MVVGAADSKRVSQQCKSRSKFMHQLRLLQPKPWLKFVQDETHTNWMSTWTTQVAVG
jgi:hypothetical protein